MARTRIHWTAEQYQALHDAAAERGLTIAEYLQRLVDRYVVGRPDLEGDGARLCTLHDPVDRDADEAREELEFLLEDAPLSDTVH